MDECTSLWRKTVSAGLIGHLLPADEIMMTENRSPSVPPGPQPGIPADLPGELGRWPRILHRWAGTAFRDLGLSVVIAFLIVVFLYQPVKVEGTSMMPSIGDQQRIFVDKFFFQVGISEIHRGDVVVFWFPQDRRVSYIKRVIGLPGDVVRVEAGRVWLNGTLLDEPYVPEEFRDEAEMPEIRLGADEYFVMGDHRNSSNDSRTWGPVTREFIYGKAVFAYWPLGEMKVVR